MRFFWQKKKASDPRQIVESLSDEIGRRNGGLEPLISFVQSMPIYSDMLQYHQRSFDDLQEIYSKLRLNGAGQWSKGFYIPIAAIANPASTDFVFTILDRDDGWDDYNKWLYISYALVEYMSGRRKDSLEGAYFNQVDA
ncbi:MAG: hypothetical protein AB7G68_08565 [Nitrospiraceae bacterium]